MIYFEHIDFEGFFILQLITELCYVTIGWLTSRPHVLKPPRLLQCVFQCLSGLLNEGHGFQI